MARKKAAEKFSEAFSEEERLSFLRQSPPIFRPITAPFQIVYADPPWRYRDLAAAGRRGASFKYPTLSFGEIKAMAPDILRISDPASCVLGLWATGPMIREAIAVMGAWGMPFSTFGFVWIKSYSVEGRLRKVARELGVEFEALVMAMARQELIVMKPSIGQGSFSRGNAEFLLLGKKGKLDRKDAGVNSVVVAEPREHSRKPPEVRDRLVRLLGDVPRIELFGQERAAGWQTWGRWADKYSGG